MNRHKFKCNFIKKINAVCCHLLHIAPLLPRITNNKFASPIVKNWHECHKHTNIVNTAGMVEYNRLQIGATPDYELFKKSIANFLALIFEAFFCKVPSQLKWIKGYSVIQSKVSLFLLGHTPVSMYPTKKIAELLKKKHLFLSCKPFS